MMACPTSARATGYAAMVVDYRSGDVLTEVNPDQIDHPASLTKMMTLYLAFEALQSGRLKWEQGLPVSRLAATREPLKLGLVPGHTVPVRDCVLGMIVLSANDCATVVAEALGGTEPAFARLMTEKARSLGMSSTTFRNASGLPDVEQVTTARDLIVLGEALYHDFPDQYHWFSTEEFDFEGRTIEGHNHLVYSYPGMDGLKTGWTRSSGSNLVSSAQRDGRRLFGVVLGAQSWAKRDELMARMLDDGFADRETPPVLVAQAAGQDTQTARRAFAAAANVISAFSPISRAEAAEVPKAAATKVTRGSTSAQAKWSVQVGAFNQEDLASEAARHAETVSGHEGPVSVVPSTSHGKRLYRARLAGFGSEKQARDACNLLAKKGEAHCVVVPPGSGARG
jgi:D-alanyl-D-alanine carboxypeptidase/D-alanyl-D-alanine carboxypeptidase (penicillin-binding protein 5/6)